MGRVCREVQEWVEEQIEQPIEEWENREEERCRREECNWWTLCLNVLFCWIVVVAVKIIRWVVVTVGKWVARVVCEVVSFVLDLVAAVVSLILSIPILGGIIRTILNWLTELFWKAVGLFDFLGSLVGIRLRKKMYFGVIIPIINGSPIATEAEMQPHVDDARRVYDQLCNIDLRFTGFCNLSVNPPDGTMTIGCDASGFFKDWWLSGSYFEFASLACKFEDGWRRISGYGAELLVFVVNNIEPDTARSSTIGCSFGGSTHNYVVVEARVNTMVTAHELGHACCLGHESDSNNLMFDSSLPTNPSLTNFQVSMVRWSRHCTYI